MLSTMQVNASCNAASFRAPARRRLAAVAHAGPRHGRSRGVGQAAPDFTATDTAGKPVRLADFKGKTGGAGMDQPRLPLRAQALPAATCRRCRRKLPRKGVVWLAINSTETGSGDYLSPGATGRAGCSDKQAAPTATLMDEDGRRRPGLRRPHHAAHVHRQRRRACWCMPAASTASRRPAWTTSPRPHHVRPPGAGRNQAGKPLSAWPPARPTAAA